VQSSTVLRQSFQVGIKVGFQVGLGYNPIHGATAQERDGRFPVFVSSHQPEGHEGPGLIQDLEHGRVAANLLEIDEADANVIILRRPFQRAVERWRILYRNDVLPSGTRQKGHQIAIARP
jgi:hypothetical protein